MFAQRAEKKPIEAMRKEQIAEKRKEALPQRPARSSIVPERRGTSLYDDLAGRSLHGIHQAVLGTHAWQTACRDSARPVVQRSVFQHKADDTNKDALQFMIDAAKQIDAILQECFALFLKNDFTGANEDYVASYLMARRGIDDGTSRMHTAAAAGYVIESMVNSRICNMPNISLQVSDLLKGTRPDIVISYGDLYGLLDITAHRSVGHIFGKKGNWTEHKDIIYVAELTYPSIDLKSDTPINLTPEQEQQLQERIHAKQMEEDERRAYYAQHFVSLRDRLLSELALHEISLSVSTHRQWANIDDSLAHFGIRSWNEGGYLKCSANNDIPVPSGYIPSVWEQNAMILIERISKNMLVGTGRLW